MNKRKWRILKILMFVIVSIVFMAASECQCTITTTYPLEQYHGTWYLENFFAYAYKSGTYYYSVIDEQEFCSLHKIMMTIDKQSAYFKIQGDDFFNSQGLPYSTYSTYGSFGTLNSYDSNIDGYIDDSGTHFYLYDLYADVYYYTANVIFDMFGNVPIDVPSASSLDDKMEGFSVEMDGSNILIYGNFTHAFTEYYFEFSFTRYSPSCSWEFANRIWYVDGSPELVYYFSPACVLDKEYGEPGNMVSVYYLDYDGVPEFGEYVTTYGIDIYYNWPYSGYYYVHDFAREYEYYSYDGFANTFQSDAKDGSEYVTFVNFPLPSAAISDALKPKGTGKPNPVQGFLK